MAHFAEILNGIVQRVTVVHDNHEAEGAQFCHDLLGGVWVQTSYNNRIRKQYAGVGYTYDADLDIFIAPQPFPSWLLDVNHDWQPPTLMPVVEGKQFVWFEPNKVWIELV